MIATLCYILYCCIGLFRAARPAPLELASVNLVIPGNSPGQQPDGSTIKTAT
jgi:hypothetical protein